MGITADITADWDAALAALAWQVDLGAVEAIGDAPISAYDLPERADWQKSAAKPDARQQPPAFAPQSTQNAAPAPHVHSPDRAIAAARAAADACRNLDELRAALADFDLLELKKGARAMVFGAGHPQADLMILGDPPSREDEAAAMPFSGAEGAMLDAMFAAIGRSRTAPDPGQAIYLACALPWRPPQDRAPEVDELAIIRPFVARHIALVGPKILVLMGNAALQLGMNRGGILRARGTWGQAFDLRTMPMAPPLHLLRNPADKRDAWADLLQIKAALR